MPIIRTAEYVTQNRMGLFYLVDLPFWLRIAVTVVFLDFMLYLWHFINHELPFFWRFLASSTDMSISSGGGPPP